MRAHLPYLILLGLVIGPAPGRAAGLTESSDVCAIRPDLCDSPRAAIKNPARRCFPARANPRLNKNHLPICRVTTAARTPSPSAVRRPASAALPVPAPTRVSPVNFESYMQSNAANPAMLRHGIEQQAFHDLTKPAVLILPSLDGSSEPTLQSSGSAAQSAAGGSAPTGSVGPAPASVPADTSPGAGAR